MSKKDIIFVLAAGCGLLIGLQSCSINNNNPIVPAPIPTNTATFTPTNSPTSTPTATFTNTPLTPCATKVVLSVPSGATTTLNSNYTYVDQFTLAANSNFNAVTVVIAGAATAASGDNLQIALYSNSSNYPGSILFTSLLHSVTSTGPATYIFNPTAFSLPAGTYWIGLHSSVQYQPNQNNSNSALNFITGGHFPNPFPTPGGASAGNAPWSYSLDTCHP